MEWPMGMANTSGLMAVHTKGTSSMESGTAMAFGQIRTKQKYTRAAIGWTKSKGSEYTNGLANRSTRDNFVKILGKDSEDCIR